MNDEIKEYIEDLLTVACCPGHDYSCKEVYKYVKQLQSNWDSLREWLEKQISNDLDGIFSYSGRQCKETLDKMDELEIGDNK